MPPLIGLIETATFARDVAAALEEEEISELKLFLANDPEQGALIPGTGGLRKLRWSASGRGKRGGGRVIYYFYDRDAPIFLFRFFVKAAKEDLSPDEKRTLAKVVDEIKVELRRKK